MNTDDSTDGAPSPEGERIAKVLSRAGVASRRDAERLVLDGRVSVNGQVVTTPATNVTERDRLSVDGQEVAKAEATRLWLYHKPAGLVTTEHDEEGRQTVFDSLPDDMPRVMSIGRLDLTSEGLLLLTNDGEVKRRLELPSTGWTRRYRVRIHGTPTESDFEPLRQGVTVEGIDYQPMEVSVDRQQGTNAWLTVTLREGKNREVRRAMESLGFTVNRLIRVSYGPFQLGDLPVGDVEEVRPKIVRDQLGLAKPEPVRRTRTKPAPGDLPATEDAPADRPERDVLATARPEGARVKRELKARAPRDRSAPSGDAPAPARAARGARADRKPALAGGAFARPRTHMRVDEDRARAAEEAEAAARDEERPRRPRAVPGEKGPRSAGFKSHGRPRAEGGEERPRSSGFRSHRAEGAGDRGPRPPRAEGDRPARPYKPREEGDRPARGFRDRDAAERPPREEGERPPRKPRMKRAEGAGAPSDRPARSFAPRPDRDGDDRPARPYKPRPPRDGDDRPARPYKPRAEGDRPARGFAPRPDRGDGDRPARPYKARPPRDGDDRPARPYKPREEGDRPARGFKPRPPREEGDRPARASKPREEGDRRPPRGDRPEGSRPPRAAGPGGPRKGPPRPGAGPKGAGPKGGRPSGPKPRRG